MSQRNVVRPRTDEGANAWRDGFDIEAMGRWLRREHRHCTAGYVSAKTGIPEATIKGWLMARTAPCLAHFLKLARAYGLSLVEACWRDPPDVIVAMAMSERIEVIDAKMARLQAERERINSQ